MVTPTGLKSRNDATKHNSPIAMPTPAAKVPFHTAAFTGHDHERRRDHREGRAAKAVSLSP